MTMTKLRSLMQQEAFLSKFEIKSKSLQPEGKSQL